MLPNLADDGAMPSLPSQVPGEYLLTLSTRSISLVPGGTSTQPDLPFGVNAKLQDKLEIMAKDFTLEYLAPLHANGFRYRTRSAQLYNRTKLLNLWRNSQIDLGLQALQWSPEGVPARKLALRYLQHMVLRFADPELGSDAIEQLGGGGRLASLGIQSIVPMAARHIPNQLPDRIYEESFEYVPPSKIIPDWWQSISVGNIGFHAWKTEWDANPDKLSSRIQIAVLDTGCETKHPHLARKSGPQVVERMNGDYLDRSGHGTHVCGILVAKEPESDSLLYLPEGIGPDLFSLRVYKVTFDYSTLSEDFPYWTSLVDAQRYISSLDHLAGQQQKGADVRVVNISLAGTGPYNPGGADPELAQFQNLIKAGIVPVAAAGNKNNMGGEVTYPACYSQVVSVGALEMSTDHQIQAWDNTSSGRTNVDKFDKSKRAIDFYAPGRAIKSTYVKVKDDDQRWAAGASMSGTSMAAPMVSAAIAIRSRVLAETTSQSKAEDLLTWVSKLNFNAPDDYRLDLSTSDFQVAKKAL